MCIAVTRDGYLILVGSAEQLTETGSGRFASLSSFVSWLVLLRRRSARLHGVPSLPVDKNKTALIYVSSIAA